MTERIRELLEEGLRHHVLGDDEMAAECFSKILAEDPTNEKAIRLLGMVRRPRGATTESQGTVAPTRAAAMPQRAPRKEAEEDPEIAAWMKTVEDRKSTRLNSSHVKISYAVFCLKKKSETATGKTT